MNRRTMRTVQCEKCQSSFPVDPSKIPASGTKARCGKCGHIFRVFPETAAPASASKPATTEAPASSIQDMILADFDQESAPAPEPTENSSPAVEVASAPPMAASAQPFKVSSEALQKYQNRINQSFKKESSAPTQERSSKVPSSKSENHRHALLLLCFALFALLLSMTARTRSISPKRWYRAVKQGLPANGSRLSPDRVRLSIFQLSDFSRVLEVNADLINASDRTVSSATVLIQLYRPDGSALLRKELPCCERPIKPNDHAHIQTRLLLPEGSDVGSYEVSVSKTNEAS